MAGTGGLSRAAEDLAAAVAAVMPASPVVVALSGGADSAVLAWAITRTGAPARAVTVDHGLPGSPALVAAAEEIASRLDMAHRIVPVEARSHSETDLRQARLAALEAACDPGEVVATGHTRDDLAETVLGNVLRGTGTSGLAGIPVERGPFVRPLLAVRRETTRSVAAELGLPFADDPQNEDPEVRRNQIRTEVLPRLADEFNPLLVEALARLGAAAGADDALLEERAVRVPVRSGDGAVLVPAAALQTLPVALVARVARRALRLAAGPHGGLSDEIAAVIAAAHGARTTIRGEVDVRREGPWVALISGEPDMPDPAHLADGEELRWGSWAFRVDAGGIAVGRHSAVVDRVEPLVVRAASSRGRISIGEGSKDVGDALAEAGVSARLRSGWPVVESDGTIVWIPGVRAAPVTRPEEAVVVRATRRRTP